MASTTTINGGVVKYDFYRGHPNNHSLPTAEIQSIMESLHHHHYEESLISSLGYGANAGNEDLLSGLRSFLEKRTKNDDTGNASPQKTVQTEFFITNGVSHGIELLCCTCTNPGDEVWIERPTYFLAPKIFTSHGLVIKPLPMKSDRKEGDGIGQVDIDQLITMVECDGVPSPKMIYVIPSYHNPTGLSMTLEERVRLAAFAIRNNILLVADEVYHLLDWNNENNSNSVRPGSMTHFNNHLKQTPDGDDQSIGGCCISVSSFTKIFAPGIRVGWIEAPPHIIQRVTEYAYINSQGGVAPFTGRLMAHAIDTGLLESYLDKLVLDYSERCSLLCNALIDEPRIKILTKRSPLSKEGGYFIWVQFPSGVDSGEFASYCLKEHSVRIMAGCQTDPFTLTDCNSTTKESIRNCARLCFVDMDKEILVQSTQIFIRAFRAFLEQNNL